MMFGRPVAYRASLMHASIGFGAGVGEKRPRSAVDRHHRREFLRQPDLHVVIEVGARHVQEALRLIGDGARRRRDANGPWS